MAQETTSQRSFRFSLRPPEQRGLLVFGDLLFAAISLFIGFYFWAAGDKWFDFTWKFLRVRVDTWFYFLPLIWPLVMIDLYDLHHARNIRSVIRGVSFAALTGLMIYAMIYFTSEPNSLPRRGVFAFISFSSILTLIWRLLFIRFFTSPAFQRRMLIIGAGAGGRTLVQAYKEIRPAPFELIGFIDDNPEKIGTQIDVYPVFADSGHLLEIIEENHISDVIVAILGEISGKTFQTLLEVQERGIEITPMPRLYEELLGRVPIHHLESDWIIRSFVDHLNGTGLYNIGKRLLDIIGSLVGMILTAIVFPFAAFAILMDSGFPIFYSQTRLGRGGKEFTIYKFRTMGQNAEEDGRAQLAQKNDPRITRVGNFLRRTRIDELPQFLNVLSGEMSLVGPRAERPELVTQFQNQIPFYRSRLLVKPGITGWAQVNYGYVSTVEDTAVKLEYDLYYIEHRSIMMDILIMLRTVGTVLNFRGR